MYSCPFCGKKLYGIFYEVPSQPNDQCPIHGEIYPDEYNGSRAYGEFKTDLHELSQIDFMLHIYMDLNIIKKGIQGLKLRGFEDAEELIEKRIDRSKITLQIAKILLLKRAVEKYARNIGYSGSNGIYKFFNDYEEIYSIYKIPLKEGSTKYSSIEILKSTRDLIAHVERKWVRENNPQILDEALEDLPDHEEKYSFLTEVVIICNYNNSNPIFVR